jgi:xanthine dehydrogenase accessory factor
MAGSKRGGDRAGLESGSVLLSRERVAVVEGGGEMGSAAARVLFLHRFHVLVLDRPLPSTLRHGVAFASVVGRGAARVMGIDVRHCGTRDAIEDAWRSGCLPVWTGGGLPLAAAPSVWVDARMRSLSEPATRGLDRAPLVLGIGPGIIAGRDAHLLIESNRGPNLGRVIQQGGSEPHSGIPGTVQGLREERILRAPCAGVFERAAARGDLVRSGDVVGRVAGAAVRVRIDGMIRGLKLSGVVVGCGHKVGDVDPRRDPALLTQQTDKARAIGRGIEEALRRSGLVSAPPPEV